VPVHQAGHDPPAPEQKGETMSDYRSGAPSTGTNVLLWIFQVIGALAFSLTGASKLAGAVSMVQLFTAVGFGQWLRYATGALEIGGALLIIFPGTAFFGACLLAAVMAGATIANLALLHASPAISGALLVLMVIIAIGRHPRKHVAHPQGHLTVDAAHPLR
jgi:uncharacterized membrane protein YphA (DoxX/SURF4 family)